MAVGHQRRPPATFGGGDLTIETFLLAPLDGQTPERISVEFLHRLRAERKFESPEALRAQVLRDAERARAWHRRARALNRNSATDILNV